MTVVKKPTPAEFVAVSEALGMHMTEEDVASYLDLMTGTIAAYNQLAEMPSHVPAVSYPRTPGYFPEGDDNPNNAWYVKTTVKGASTGKLAGKTVALKDNVCLAGVPMMNGASTLEGYVPDVDATIVTRMLDAGATILGKVHCEYFCFSGGSHTSAYGPVHNPMKRGYSAGGSSSGSAAVVGTGEVDMAIGGDQGGSIRMPASYCGIYGLKPTWGLVPYTGVMPIELTLDHTGPMTATAADNALLLEVLAGPDGLDPRQGVMKMAPYTEALGQGIRGLRIGVVKEGFGHPQSESDVDGMVRKGADILRKLGAVVEDVSIPMHASAMPIWSAIAHEGATAQMMLGNGFGFNWKGLYVTSLLDAHSAWRQRADELSDTLKITTLAGYYFIQKYRGHYYAKAQNLARKLTAAYDAMLAKYDLLLMPTVPIKATKIPDAGAARTDYITRAFEMLPNCAPFDVSGHPAISMPCGLSEGLPAGLMLVGKHFDEFTLYKAAGAWESKVDWKTLKA
ncbi:MAG TPA: amidase [Burkholderiales bacterium]|nr:amidase [Burkholderiales bacterium]